MPPSPRPRRRRPRRDGRRPLVRVPSSQQPRGSPVRLSCGDQSPRRSGTSPPARPFHAAVALRGIPSNTLGHLRNRKGSSCARGTTHRSDRSRSARIRCGPPLLSQATHRPSQHPSAPPIAGSRAGADGRPAAREPQGAGPQPIPNRRIRCGRGFVRGKRIFISRKSFLSLKNPNKSILTLKIVKPFPESF
jgi:hypothetical protein